LLNGSLYVKINYRQSIEEAGGIMPGEKVKTVRGTLTRAAAHAFVVIALIMIGISAGRPDLGVGFGGGYGAFQLDSGGQQGGAQNQ
jgi:hypothetical protein